MESNSDWEAKNRGVTLYKDWVWGTLSLWPCISPFNRVTLNKGYQRRLLRPLKLQISDLMACPIGGPRLSSPGSHGKVSPMVRLTSQRLIWGSPSLLGKDMHYNWLVAAASSRSSNPDSYLIIWKASSWLLFCSAFEGWVAWSTGCFATLGCLCAGSRLFTNVFKSRQVFYFKLFKRLPSLTILCPAFAITGSILYTIQLPGSHDDYEQCIHCSSEVREARLLCLQRSKTWNPVVCLCKRTKAYGTPYI